MGTNYYTIKNYCEHCKRFDQEHIGKSSIGWTFAFQATETVENYDEWLENVKSSQKIIDEYGREITVEELVKMIEDKRNNPNNQAIRNPGFAYLDKYGNSFTFAEFS